MNKAAKAGAQGGFGALLRKLAPGTKPSSSIRLGALPSSGSFAKEQTADSDPASPETAKIDEEAGRKAFWIDKESPKESAKNHAPSPQSAPSGSRETIITEDAVIVGSITSKCGLKVFGTVQGNVTSDETVYIGGIVEGDVSGANVFLKSGKMQGNISSKAFVTLDSASSLVGNIKCDTFDHDGRLTGNVEVSSSMVLGKNAQVIGDIVAESFSAQIGVTINGEIRVTRKDAKAQEK